MNSRKLEIDDHINSTLEKIKNEYIRISKWLYEEELKMREDLEEMADPGEMERLMEPFMDRVDHQIDSHYMKLRELAVNFEDLSSRSVKQIRYVTYFVSNVNNILYHCG